jgi:hypothetical protein
MSVRGSRQACRLWSVALLAACAVAHAATPAEYRQRVGVYVWGAMASDLTAAAEDVKRLGADQAVRVFIGPAKSWDPADKSDNSPLDVKVRRADYRAFLAGFPVVMLTAYDAASFERYKFVALDAEHLAATTDEFRRFTLELAKTPGRKIISNWEFENDCPADRWPACIAYYQARLDGVAKGRSEAKTLGYPGEILTAFEFTIVPGFAGKPSGLAEAATKLKGVDYISYSSWWSLRWDASEAKVREDFDYLVKMLGDFVKEKKLGTKLIIGEFGEYWDLHPSGARMRAVVDACLAGGVEYLFDWVLYEQPGKKDNWGRDASHFGKYGLDRKLTPQGEAFRRWFLPVVRRGPPKRRHAAGLMRRQEAG